ncbi:MAG: class I SAM-dependent methyltransferase [Desulfuromonadaceae bacterium]|nr:class I SAM-dependent methyltransferase [Desulfuromonadaceae bacterium]
MDPQTLHFYTRQASDYARRADRDEVTDLQAVLRQWLPSRCRVLELGGGSGRDAAWLQTQGYQVTYSDGCEAMVKQAVAQHGGLQGRALTAEVPLPSSHPLLGRRFDAVVAIALILHLDDGALAQTLAQLVALLVPAGRLILTSCVGAGRCAGVQTAARRDEDGRLMCLRQPDDVSHLACRYGLQQCSVSWQHDGRGRDRLWYTLVFER